MRYLVTAILYLMMGVGFGQGEDILGCNIPVACNYDPNADYYLPGSCDFSCLFGIQGGEACADPLACNYGENAVCEYMDENGDLCAIVGCMDDTACNYDDEAQVAGICDYTTCVIYGCTNVNSCNYDILANTDNGSCEYESCFGCTDADASNYNPTATIDDGSCLLDMLGCMEFLACNYNPMATVSSGDCDLVSCYGCNTPTACNYSANVIYFDASCEFAVAGYDCAGNCIEDADLDGVCDSDELVGCTDSNASNFDPTATDDSGQCQYSSGGCTDQTACNFDFLVEVEDGSCEYTSCSGCIAPLACNFDADAILSDGTCYFPDTNGVCAEECDSDIDSDGICDADEIEGCIYSKASNYNSEATDDDGSCIFLGCVGDTFNNYNKYANTDDSDCTNTPMNADFNGDGIVQLEDLLDFLISYGMEGPDWTLGWVNNACGVVPDELNDVFEANANGCTYVTASNYDASATMDLGNCVFTGCTDVEALNFNHLANTDDTSCSYHVCPDFNGDGIVQAGDLLDFLLAWGTEY